MNIAESLDTSYEIIAQTFVPVYVLPLAVWKNVTLSQTLANILFLPNLADEKMLHCWWGLCFFDLLVMLNIFCIFINQKINKYFLSIFPLPGTNSANCNLGTGMRDININKVVSFFKGFIVSKKERTHGQYNSTVCYAICKHRGQCDCFYEIWSVHR